MRWLAYMTRIRMGTFSTIGTPFFFRLSNAKMMFRLIFIIGCVWNSTPQYTPNIWNSKRYSERFGFTMHFKQYLIINNLHFYDISWMYRFESLSLRWTNRTLPDKEQPSPTNSTICGTFLSPYVCPGHHLEERTGNPDRSTDTRVTWSDCFYKILISKLIPNVRRQKTSVS